MGNNYQKSTTTLGGGGWTRTNEMIESKSIALPLGYTAMSTLVCPSSQASFRFAKSQKEVKQNDQWWWRGDLNPQSNKAMVFKTISYASSDTPPYPFVSSHDIF